MRNFYTISFFILASCVSVSCLYRDIDIQNGEQGPLYVDTKPLTKKQFDKVLQEQPDSEHGENFEDTDSLVVS